MSCGHPLTWFDLVPVISWFALKGRCRFCNARISPQYPLVELLTGIVFALIGGSPFPIDVYYRLAYCAIGALLVAIAVYDLRHTIIPDLWVYALSVLALATTGSLSLSLDHSFSIPAYALSGPLSASPIFFLWLVSRGAWMGFGDVKLALSFGWLLGPVYGLAAVFLAFILGAVVSVPLLVLSSRRWERFIRMLPVAWRHIAGDRSRSSTKPPREAMPKVAFGFTMKSEIPFGPFLSASCLILLLCWLYAIDVLGLVGL